MAQRSSLWIGILLSSCLLTQGCGDGGAAVLKRRSDLSILGSAYRDFQRSGGQSASGAAELVEFMSAQSSASDPKTSSAIASLQEGDIVMIWNAAAIDTAESAHYLLGFEARVPARGGYVVMGDGTVALMTAKQFSQAQMFPQNRPGK